MMRIAESIRKNWKSYLRWREVHGRGWASLGEMFIYGETWDQRTWDRKIRRANRLYRLTYGKHGPWKPYQGY